MSLTLNQIVNIASADNEFTMVTPSDDIFYANQETERLTDVIATIANAVISKADSAHNHSNKADLVNGMIPASQLPSFVDDVLEYTALANFPTEGESGKIYVDQTTNKVYRWSGSTYVEISASLALGETSSTAYRGDRGATAYTHSQNGDVHVTSAQKTTWDAKSNFSGSYNDLTDKPAIPSAYTHPSTHPASMITGLADVATSGDYNDLSNRPTIPSAYTHPSYTAKSSGLYKVTVDATGHVSATTAVTKADITALGIPASDTNTTYAAATSSADGLMPASDKSKLDGIDSGANNYTLPAAGSALGGVKTGGDVTISDGTISVNDDSHNHVVSNIDGLQSTLDGKASSSHKHYATAIAVTGEDLNDYTDAGIYAFAQAYTPTNIPAGSNGWLVVIPWQQDSGTIKQIWFRHGTVGSNDFETYVRTKIGTNAWGSWSKYYTTSNPPTYAEVGASPAFTSSNGGVEYSYGSNSGKNVLTEISNMPVGFHTAYAISGTTGNPRTSESFRFLIHKTSGTIGWIMAWDAQGSIFTNYQSAANTFKGWKCLYDTNPNSMILWSGASYLSSPNSTPQTVTPSKKLSECRTGWMLLWSDYDPGDGANDTDFCTTFIPKYTPSGGTWGGKAFYCDIPMYVGSDATDLSTEKRCIKPIYVHDDCLKGSYQNTSGGRNDVVLRAVYEV